MLLLILIALAIPGAPNQSRPKILSHDHAIVTPQRIETSHGRGEDRYTVVTIRPLVTGLPEPVLKRIRKELELKNVLGGYHHFYKNRLMYGLDYRVTYNQNQILAMTFSFNAYFADHDRVMAFDLRNGTLIKVEDLFHEGRTTELAKLVDQRLQAELDQMVRDYKGTLDLRYIWKSNGPVTFTAEDLACFSINDKGITFFYDPHFYHVYAWAEPEGRYFFKYSELKSFLKPDSVVSQFVE